VAASGLTTPHRLDVAAPIPVTDRLGERSGANRRSFVPALCVLAGYALLGVIAFWPVATGITSRLNGPPNSDSILFVWFIGWVPHALAHGLNPLFSNALLVPHGVNLAENTSSAFLGLVSAPLTLLFGPTVSSNLIMMSAMPMSAAAAFIVLRMWKVWLPAAALGGLLYGFSPYMVSESIAHPELTFIPIPPLIALTIVRIFQRKGSPGWLGVTLGLLVVVQFLISQEVIAIVAVLCVAALVIVGVRHPRGVGDMVRVAWRPSGVALVVAGALMAYPVWLMVAGPQHFTGTTFPLDNAFHNDVLSLIAPSHMQRFSLGLRSLGNRLTVGPETETVGYVGIPLVLLTAVIAWRSRRSPRMQLTAALLVLAALLSFGPHLGIDGHRTSVPGPFLLIAHLPFLANILPSRFSFATDALFAAIVAFGLDDLRLAGGSAPRNAHARARSTVPGRTAVLLTSAVAAVTVITLFPNWPYTTQSAQALPQSVRARVPAGDPVAITYPFDTTFLTQPELWQADDGYAFKLLGGNAYHPDAAGKPTLSPEMMEPDGLQRFLLHEQGSTVVGGGSPITIPTSATTRSALALNHVRLVIVDRSEPNSDAVVQVFTSALGPPDVVSGQFSVWTGTSVAP
jgi:hypothetical protein